MISILGRSCTPTNREGEGGEGMKLTRDVREHLSEAGWEIREADEVRHAQARLELDLCRNDTPDFVWPDISEVAPDYRLALGWSGYVRIDFGEEEARWGLRFGGEATDIDETGGIERVADTVRCGTVLNFGIETVDVGEPPVVAMLGEPQVSLCRVERDWRCALFALEEGEHLIRALNAYNPEPRHVPRFYRVDEAFADALRHGRGDPALAMFDEIDRLRYEHPPRLGVY